MSRGSASGGGRAPAAPDARDNTTRTAGGGRQTRRARTAAPVPTSPAGFPNDALSRRRPRPPPAPGGVRVAVLPGGRVRAGAARPAADGRRPHRMRAITGAVGGGRPAADTQSKDGSAGAHELGGAIYLFLYYNLYSILNSVLNSILCSVQ